MIGGSDEADENMTARNPLLGRTGRNTGVGMRAGEMKPRRSTHRTEVSGF